ncbi:MAG: hypothetical protein K2N78_03225 [Oscillospiraceae bacterium]|nr:hypothetical protein [Oscillospiraceae bacterium]
MLAAILGIATVVCAAGWFGSRLSTMTLLHFMGEKGYALPTDAELKACSRKAAEQMLSWWPDGKGTR